MRVLVATDNDSIAEYLTGAGYEVKILYANDMALKTVKETKAETVVYMTTVNAVIPHEDVLMELKETGYRIVLIADAGDTIINYAAALGITDILTLPINLEDLVYRLENRATTSDVARLIRSAGHGKNNVTKNETPETDVERKGVTARVIDKFITSIRKKALNSSDKIPEIPDFAAIGEYPGVRCYQSVRDICSANPSAVIVPASTLNLLNTIKELRREYSLSAVPVVVIGNSDTTACFSAGADECLEILDERGVEKIRALAKRMKEMWAKATKDGLTGLYKREFLSHFLEEQTRKYQETGVAFSILMLDLDHFKQVNDIYDYSAGDTVLKQFAEFLKKNSRKTDVVARYGGEEFVIVYCGNPDAETIAERLCKKWSLQKIRLPNRVEMRSTFSAGLANVAANGGNWKETLKAANDALHRAKNAGRNRVVVAGRGLATVSNPAGPVTINEPINIIQGERAKELMDVIKKNSGLVIFDADLESGKMAYLAEIDPSTLWKHDWRLRTAVPAKVYKNELFCVEPERGGYELYDRDIKALFDIIGKYRDKKIVIYTGSCHDVYEKIAGCM